MPPIRTHTSSSETLFSDTSTVSAPATMQQYSFYANSDPTYNTFQYHHHPNHPTTTTFMPLEPVGYMLPDAHRAKTRKRITPVQLKRLEKLYKKDTHPSREQREELARQLDMELKSVTIWFQNKRQTAKKSALNNATNTSTSTANSPSSSGPSTQQSSVLTPSSARRTPRPSLERIASLSELPTASSRSIYSPSYHAEHESCSWGNPHSSPSNNTNGNAASPRSLPGRSNTWAAGVTTAEDRSRAERAWSNHRAGGKLTLEWACAKARTSRKSQSHCSSPSVSGGSSPPALTRGDDEFDDEGAVTEVEPDQPDNLAHRSSSFKDEGIPRAFTKPVDGGAPIVSFKINPQDEMDAALALCGLLQS